jgi:hypothetical protein
VRATKKQRKQGTVPEEEVLSGEQCKRCADMARLVIRTLLLLDWTLGNCTCQLNCGRFGCWAVKGPRAARDEGPPA